MKTKLLTALLFFCIMNATAQIRFEPSETSISKVEPKIWKSISRKEAMAKLFFCGAHKINSEQLTYSIIKDTLYVCCNVTNDLNQQLPSAPYKTWIDMILDKKAIPNYEKLIIKEVFFKSENPVPYLTETLNGTWIEAKYDPTTKTVEHNAQLQKTGLIFKSGGIEKAIHTIGAKRNPNKDWQGKYIIKDDSLLTITYLAFITTEGLQKETTIEENYNILKINNKELVILRNDIDGKVIPQAYLKQQ